MGGDGHLFWIVLLVGVWLNSSGDPGKDCLCWKLVLWKVGGLSGVLGGVRGRVMG